jgi:hypothetical protein
MSYQLRLKEAVSSVKAGMTVRLAAQQYTVPKSTINDRITGKRGMRVARGSKNSLSDEVEERIVKYTIQAQRNGYGKTYADLRVKVEEVVTSLGLDIPKFKDGKPGKKWYTGFMKRHEDRIRARSTLPLGRERSVVTPEKIESWFIGATVYLSEENALDILEDPSRIYNADETGFPLAPKSGKVIASTADSHVYAVTSSNKHQVTVMVACSAAAHYPTPMIVLPGKRFTQNPAPTWPELFVGRSDNGWMTGELLFTWVSKCKNLLVNIFLHVKKYM